MKALAKRPTLSPEAAENLYTRLKKFDDIEANRNYWKAEARGFEKLYNQAGVAILVLGFGLLVSGTINFMYWMTS